MGYIGEKAILGRISRGFASGVYIVLDGYFELFEGLDDAFKPMQSSNL
jgi:hypothetical protein